MSTLQKFTLENGVRVLVEPFSHVQSAAIGLWCRTGSRHERENEAGITHLIEHMLFKGTNTRNSKEIAESIEGRGGVLNAFTDKEMTCYYTRVLSDDIENAVDVLSDMMLNSKLDPDELAKEIGVVQEEIRRSEDEPGDQVHELHLGGRWGEHPLGKPIIGTHESVGGFKSDDLRAYIDRRYRGENIILSIAGNVNPETFKSLAGEKLSGVASGVEDEIMPRPSGSANMNYIEKDVEQVHFCIGTDATSVYDPQLYTMAVLDGILGGGMSSRLFQEIREKRGLAYSIGSYTLNYTAGGAYTVYGGTSKETWPQVQELIHAEFESVKTNGFDADEVERCKRHIKGNIILALEGMSSRMMRNSRNELLHQRDIPLEETMAKIDSVTNDDLVEIARKILSVEKISTTAIGPA
ncbi:MAG: insulinase family protein [Fimbriimonadaceae bacterium]|nr:insulinase family protein [Fimbriimonadaceae bacterium]